MRASRSRSCANGLDRRYRSSATEADDLRRLRAPLCSLPVVGRSHRQGNRVSESRSIGKYSGPLHHKWRGDAASNQAKRTRARIRFVLGSCERCGERAVDRHHRDGNTGNNIPENISALCRRCHMVVDGRLERQVARLKEPRDLVPRRPCIICPSLSRILRKGRCNACDKYFAVHGVERPPRLYLKRWSW